MENLHLLYNKTYYKNLNPDLSVSDIKEKNERMIGSIFYEKDYTPSPVSKDTFCLKTVYPGLLVGTGYAHGISNDEDFKIGFSFDYVTGQPYIPGSSVKGIMNSLFSSHPEVVAELLNCDKETVSKLKENIFADYDEAGRDIFLDAVIKHGDKTGKVLSNDYITPHVSPTKNPKPIKLLKVLPDVVFEFRFVLKDTVVQSNNGEYRLKAEDKKNLFKMILCEFGAGAKTNVGFGNLTDASNEPKPYGYPVAPADGNIQSRKPEAHRKNRSAVRDNSQKADADRNNSKPNGKKCPSCGMFNYRCYKDSTDETKSWKAGFCFKCGKPLGLK